MMEAQPIRLGLLQYPVGRPASIADFAARLDRWLEEGRASADLLVLPEYAAVELGAGLNGGEASEAAEQASAIIRSRIQPPGQPPPGHIYRPTSQGPTLAPVKHGKPGDTFIVFQEHDSTFRVLHVASGLGIAAAKKVTAAKQLCAELNAVPDGSCRGIGYHPDDATLKRWMAISDEFIGKHQDKFWK
ncbi:MAG: hypothetical protein EBU14_05655 [Acetobacteraceae bacterium]|nr:hypothetical protein [Acetobacteraceae bacterium]